MKLNEILKNEDREIVENAIVRDNIERIVSDIMLASSTLLNTWKGNETTAIHCFDFIILQAKHGLELLGDTDFKEATKCQGKFTKEEE